MEQTLRGGASLAQGTESAVQNTASSTPTVKLVLVWLAVSLPMLWGVLKTLEDIQHLFP